MINTYNINDKQLVLKSDLASEFPIYFYYSSNKLTFCYSESIDELLNDSRVIKPLKISDEGLSFLLQSGVVPPPKTAYQDIYVLGVGDTANISTKNGEIEVCFSFEFPFMNANRLQCNEMQPDENVILELLAKATIEKVDKSKPSYLFHSAGKDSNSIALALAEAGWQDKVTLITHKSKGAADESGISAKIAKQLGFSHQILNEVDQLQTEHHKVIDEYFINAPLPCTDNVTLAYPLYTQQLPKLKGANIIDGGGNDVYMMTPPSKRSVFTLPIASITSNLSFLRSRIDSGSILNSILRTPAEWCGINGFSLKDANQLFAQNESVYPYWKNESNIRKGWDVFDFKTDILTTNTAAEVHIRKVRNFSNAIQSNLILPFADSNVAEYFATMPEKYLFDRKQLKNKLILRKMLQNRIGLDSDALGKMGFTYDSRSMILNNFEHITSEIFNCSLWDTKKSQDLVFRLKNKMNNEKRYSLTAGRLIYRLYLLSAWKNKCKYLN